MFDDDDRRLIQVASIANTIAGAENAAPWRALVWLAAQAESGVLAARLYIPVRTRTVDTHYAQPDESLRVWRNMARRTAERKSNLLDYHLPTAASTWFVHAGDLALFIASAQMSDSTKAALLELLQMHSGPVQAPDDGAAIPEEKLDFKSDTTTPSEAKPIQRAAAQDAAIIARLIELGHNPLALQRNKKGRRGVKAETRAALGTDGMWSGSTVFDKAWDRLAGKGAIAYQE